MDSIRLLAVVAVGVLLLAGCDEGPPQSASAATEPAGNDVASLDEEVGGGVWTSEGADTVIEGALEQVESDAVDAGERDASLPLGLSGSSDDLEAEAERLLRQVHQYIDDEQFKMAERGLSELKRIKHMLPRTLGDQIPVAEQLLQAEKTIAEKLDGLP